MSGELRKILVNEADWDERPPNAIPEFWLIVNAPRPLAGPITWTGQFRHGIFYAAAPEILPGTFGWAADDAWLIQFITNDQIEKLVLAKFAEYGYDSAAAAGVTIAEQAYCMGLPWHEKEGSQ